MKVAILYSGGKDSTYAIEYALKNKFDIAYLLSIKPTRKDCYLFHFSTVEQTKDLSKILDIPHIYTKCNVANPEKEASMVKKIIMKNQVDAVLLGGTGLQETQINTLKNVLSKINVKVFATHQGKNHELVLKEMINKGYEIVITQIASDGLKKWLGRKLTKENFEDFRLDSIKYGFHIGGEGGYFDTLVVNGPIFKKKLQIISVDLVYEDEYSGHIVVRESKLITNKRLLSRNAVGRDYN